MSKVVILKIIFPYFIIGSSSLKKVKTKFKAQLALKGTKHALIMPILNKRNKKIKGNTT